MIRSLTLIAGLAIALGCAASSNDDGGVAAKGGSGGSSAGGSASGGAAGASAGTGGDASGGAPGSGGEEAGGAPGAGGEPGSGGQAGSGGPPPPCTSGCCITFGGAAHGTATCMVLGPSYDAAKMITKMSFLGMKVVGSNVHSDNFSFDVRLRGMATAKSYATADLTLASGHIDIDTAAGDQLSFEMDVTAEPPVGTMSVTLTGDGTHGVVDATLMDVDTGKMSATTHVTF